MTDHTRTSPQRSLFARKGEAEPAPAVAFVSLRHMHGEPDQRADRPDRREQLGAHRHDGVSPDSEVRRGPDHDGRRHFTPRSGLAFGQQYVPWGTTETEADASEDTARERKAKRTVGALSVASLSALIHRHRDGSAQPASARPEPALTPQRVAATASPAPQPPEPGPAAPQQPEALAAAGPTKVDMAYLSGAGTPGRRPASPKSPADQATPHASQRSATRTPKIKRKKVTVRLEPEQFLQIKALADDAGKTHQSVLAKAVAAYLNKVV